MLRSSGCLQTEGFVRYDIYSIKKRTYECLHINNKKETLSQCSTTPDARFDREAAIISSKTELV